MSEPTGNSETLPDEVGINVEDVVNNNVFRNMLDDNTMYDDLSKMLCDTESGFLCPKQLKSKRK
jgi:hypothetical protein